MTRSFLKWAGGKHRVAKSLEKIILDEPPFGISWKVMTGERYLEPFFGSGSMYFHLSEAGVINSRKKSFLSDLNPILISTMKIVSRAENIPDLLEKLSVLQRRYPLDKPHPNPRGQTKEVREKRMYYRLRRKMNKIAKNLNLLDTKQCIELASLAIFLNKTCFNGLWRMNASGDFNVPEGDYTRPKNIAQEDILLACQKQLNKSIIRCCDWKETLGKAKSGDLVYIDPPYMPIKIGDNIFTNYYSEGFTIDEQKELAKFTAKAAKRGVRVIASNHDTEGNPNVREIYNEAAKSAGIQEPKIVSIDVTRTISCKGHGRVKVSEVLIFLSNNKS